MVGTYNLGKPKQKISKGEITRLILEATDLRKLEIISLPETPGSPPRRCPDMTQTNRVIGYSFFFELKKGIGATYKWYAKKFFSKGEGSA